MMLRLLGRQLKTHLLSKMLSTRLTLGFNLQRCKEWRLSTKSSLLHQKVKEWWKSSKNSVKKFSKPLTKLQMESTSKTPRSRASRKSGMMLKLKARLLKEQHGRLSTKMDGMLQWTMLKLKTLEQPLINTKPLHKDTTWARSSTISASPSRKMWKSLIFQSLLLWKRKTTCSSTEQSLDW